jgi:hypothetical protein
MIRIPTKAPACIIVVEAEEPVRVYTVGDQDRLLVSASEAEAMLLLDALAAADESERTAR